MEGGMFVQNKSSPLHFQQLLTALIHNKLVDPSGALDRLAMEVGARVHRAYVRQTVQGLPQSRQTDDQLGGRGRTQTPSQPIPPRSPPYEPNTCTGYPWGLR